MLGYLHQLSLATARYAFFYPRAVNLDVSLYLYLKTISKQHEAIFKILSDDLGLFIGTFSPFATHAICCLILAFYLFHTFLCIPFPASLGLIRYRCYRISILQELVDSTCFYYAIGGCLEIVKYILDSLELTLGWLVSLMAHGAYNHSAPRTLLPFTLFCF